MSLNSPPLKSPDAIMLDIGLICEMVLSIKRLHKPYLRVVLFVSTYSYCTNLGILTFRQNAKVGLHHWPARPLQCVVVYLSAVFHSFALDIDLTQVPTHIHSLETRNWTLVTAWHPPHLHDIVLGTLICGTK